MAAIEKTETNDVQSEAIDSCESVDKVLQDSAESAIRPYGLRVSDDGISLLLDCPDPFADLEATVNRIENDFKEMGLPEFPDSEILTKILAQSCQPGENLIDFPIMKGWLPTVSIDGRLEWEQDFFSEEKVSEDEEDCHDFWDQNDQQSVTKDQLLARVIHPIPGEPGLDVFSREIPVPKPNAIKMRSGKGVRQIDEGQWLAYYADTSGRIRFQDETLLVDDVYIIKGDVSLETGNIAHTGTVHVEGDVKTGATIEADGDILIKGMMDPCNIICGGSLTVMGGIVGQEGFQIEVLGDVTATYIGGAMVRCGGNVTVANEIANAEIKASGQVLVPTGRIAGGTVIGCKGIEIAEAGGSGATATLLIVGFDFTVDRRVEAHEERIAQLEEAQDKIQDVLNAAGISPNSVPPAENQELGELWRKSKVISETLIKEHAAIRVELQKSTLVTDEEVIMTREIWSGTTIQIGPEKIVVKSSIKKPRVARLKMEKVRVLPFGTGNSSDSTEN